MANQTARLLRGDMTDPERLLWSLLRSRRFADCKFRRQHPIGPFIADFACVQHKLIIEADASQHVESAYDVRRTGWLLAQGWRVMRVWNGDILYRPNDVLDQIWRALEG
jgi:very-short-patch-repair endonuclease